LLDNGYVVLNCAAVGTFYLTNYLEVAEQTRMNPFKEVQAIVDSHVKGVPQKLRFQQKLKGSQNPHHLSTEKETKATKFARKWITDNISHYFKMDDNMYLVPSWFGRLFSKPVPGKIKDPLEKMQPFHADDNIEQGIFGYSAIFNTDAKQDFTLYCCPGSHKLTHQQQWEQQVHEHYLPVKVPPGKFILFFRNLIHAGGSYLERQDRFFSYIDVGPMSHYDRVDWPNPDRVWRHADPSTKMTWN